MPLPIRNSAGPIWSKKMNGPDHLLLRRRQRAAHLEAAEIAGARHDHLLDGIAGSDRREWGLGRVASSRITSFLVVRPSPT